MSLDSHLANYSILNVRLGTEIFLVKPSSKYPGLCIFVSFSPGVLGKKQGKVLVCCRGWPCAVLQEQGRAERSSGFCHGLAGGLGGFAYSNSWGLYPQLWNGTQSSTSHRSRIRCPQLWGPRGQEALQQHTLSFRYYWQWTHPWHQLQILTDPWLGALWAMMDIHNGLVLLGELLPLSPRSHPSFARVMVLPRMMICWLVNGCQRAHRICISCPVLMRNRTL